MVMRALSVAQPPPYRPRAEGALESADRSRAGHTDCVFDQVGGNLHDNVSHRHRYTATSKPSNGRGGRTGCALVSKARWFGLV